MDPWQPSLIQKVMPGQLYPNIAFYQAYTGIVSLAFQQSQLITAAAKAMITESAKRDSALASIQQPFSLAST